MTRTDSAYLLRSVLDPSHATGRRNVFGTVDATVQLPGGK
jgi:hypothetical protein